MKTRGLSLILAIAMAFSLLTGCSRKPAPVENGSDGSVSLVEEDIHFTTYQEVLDYVQNGISNTEGEDYYIRAGLSRCFSSYMGVTEDDDSIINFGWATRDMDGDGEDELLLGFDSYEQPFLFNIFGADEDGVNCILRASDMNVYGLGENGEIYNFDYTQDETPFYTLYEMSNHTLIPAKVLMYIEEKDPEQPWRLSTDFDWDSGKPVTEDEAQEILEEMSIYPFEMTPFPFG